MLVIERKYPARKFPRVRGWLPRAIYINAFQALSMLIAGIAWNGWMLRHHLWRVPMGGTISGALVGYFVLTFTFYWWHVARHRSDFLWR
jgi:sterol desaturase/sphingolipid hydroxylase (fatty acid hydroxylase superfamily)